MESGGERERWCLKKARPLNIGNFTSLQGESMNEGKEKETRVKWMLHLTEDDSGSGKEKDRGARTCAQISDSRDLLES